MYANYCMERFRCMWDTLQIATAESGGNAINACVRVCRGAGEL